MVGQWSEQAARSAGAQQHPDPISDFIREGKWEPAEAAQADMVNEFKKANNMK
tara:strand:+ start:179 stop:337 length:159 start_codon:yes stop_codon:yes gene_type:complete